MFVAAWHSPPITGAVPRAPDVLDMPALAVREDPWMWLNIERGGILWTLINGGGVWPVLEEPTSKVARPPAIGPAHSYLASWLLLAGAAVYLVINGSAAPECVKSAGHRDDARSLN